MNYELHPACSIWPEMNGADLVALADDIAANGLLEAITLTPDGLLLDGRNRYLACKMAGVDVRVETYDGNPWLFSISKNRCRRHMDAVDLARIAAELAIRPHGEHSKTDLLAGKSVPPTIAEAAKAAGISSGTLSDAKTVLADGTPEEKKAVFKDKKAGLRSTATKIRKRNKAPKVNLKTKLKNEPVTAPELEPEPDGDFIMEIKEHSPTMAKAIEKVQELVCAGLPVRPRVLEGEIGISHVSIESAMAIVRDRFLRGDPILPIDSSKLPKREQAKLAQYVALSAVKLQDEFDARVKEAAAAIVKGLIENRDARDTELLEQAQQVINRRAKMPFEASEYITILRTLHPDNSASPEIRMEAFKIFKSREMLLRPDGKFAKRISTMPRSFEGLMACREQATARRRKKGVEAAEN